MTDIFLGNSEKDVDRVFINRLPGGRSKEMMRKTEVRLSTFSELEEILRRRGFISYYTGGLAGKEAAGCIREMIDKNYMNADASREYADRVHLSQTYVCKMFREENGVSIGKLIFSRRMEKAAELLQSTNLTIREVAVRVGYPNFSYFCKRFKDYYAMTPRTFRRQYWMHREEIGN